MPVTQIKLWVQDESGRELEPPYSFLLLVNSAPPPVKNPLLQIDSETDGKYVLCFFAPKTEGTVHIDTKKIWINDKYFELNSDGTVNDSVFSSTPGTLYPLESGGMKFSDFSTPEGYKACYYQTNEPFNEELEKKFDIILEDEYGFKAVSSISNKAKKLSGPVILSKENDSQIVDSASYTADDDTKIFKIKISHNGTYDGGENFAGNVKIFYKIKNTDSDEEITGSFFNSKELSVKKGKYIISAYAQKEYCVDSDQKTVTDVTINENPVYYVAPDGTYGSDDDDGSINKPFRTFKQAVDAFSDELYLNDAPLTIYLKNNVSNYCINQDENIMIDLTNSLSGKDVLIQGFNGRKTINLSKLSGISVLFVANGGPSVTFKDINITGGSATDSVISSKHSLTLENCSITENNRGGVSSLGTLILKGQVNISGNTYTDTEGNIKKSNLELKSREGLKDDKITNISELSPSSKIGITMTTKPTEGNPSTFVESWPLSLCNPWDIFFSDDDDYFVDVKEDNSLQSAVLKKQGALVEINQNVLIEFTSNSSVPNVQKFISDNEISIESYELYCGRDTVPKANYQVTLESDKKTIKVTTGSLKAGKYILNLKFEYNGNTYEANLSFTKN